MLAHENASGFQEVDVTVIVDRFYGSLYRFAVSFTGNESDAVDLVQRTFRILSRRLHQIHHFSKIECWLFTTLHRIFLVKIRHQRKHSKVEFLPQVHDFAAGDPESWRFLNGRNLLAALSRVDETCRAALGLFHLSNLSCRDIAEILEIPVGTLMSRLSRGKEQL